MKFLRLLTISAVVCLGLAATGRTEITRQESSSSCDNSRLHVTVQNLSGQMQEGYIAEAISSPFSVEPQEKRDVILPVSKTLPEHRVEIFLSDMSRYQDLDSEDSTSRRCVGYIQLPSSCSTEAPAGNLYIYQTRHGSQCFVRTVAKLPRASDSAIALKK
jgi:hypothetical protein